MMIRHFTIKPLMILNTLMVFFLINGFWLVASYWVFTFRPYFNYDYLLAIALVPFSIVAALVMFLLIYFQEIFISNALIFHFNGVSDFLRSVEFVKDLDLVEFFKIQDIILLASFSAGAVLAARHLKNKTNFMAVLIVMVFAFSADQLNGSSYLIKSDHQVLPGNISGSSALKIYTSFKENDVPRTKPKALDQGVLPLPKDKVINWAQANPSKSVLYVLVESYGLNDSAAVNEWLYSQLVSPDISEDYKIAYGNAKFSGATTASEMRHLCGLKGNYNSLLPQEALVDCIPRAFSELGYPVVGAHGFTENMFRRKEWWADIGIKERLFINEFSKMNAPYCGSGMYGICDDYVIQYLGRRMIEQRGFYYHLTLNTHLPIVKTKIPDALSVLCEQEEMAKEACTLNAKIGAYFRTLSGVVAELAEKPLVFIVGDHMPPFSSTISRKFSNSETPYIILTPDDQI